MNIFVTSDIHSFFMPFKKALDEKGFEPNNSEHLLVICGDLFDRGDESNELLEFINSLTNVVLIRGNHEDLIEEVWGRGYCESHDRSNGTQKTINDIFYKNSNVEPYTPLKVSEKLLSPVLNKMVDYFETEHYIFCHSWIPRKVEYTGKTRAWYSCDVTHKYMPDWREANDIEWMEARWPNPFKLAKEGFNQTGKTIVFGHWHTSWPRYNYDGMPEFSGAADFSPYYGDGFIGLDACTAYTKKCNVIVLEDNLLPEE